MHGKQSRLRKELKNPPTCHYAEKVCK